MSRQSRTMLDAALGNTTPLLDMLDTALKSPLYYETLKPQPNQVRTDIESVLRQNMSHRELQAYPELTDLMIDELEKTFNHMVLDKVDQIVGRIERHTGAVR